LNNSQIALNVIRKSEIFEKIFYSNLNSFFFRF